MLVQKHYECLPCGSKSGTQVGLQYKTTNGHYYLGGLQGTLRTGQPQVQASNATTTATFPGVEHLVECRLLVPDRVPSSICM